MENSVIHIQATVSQSESVDTTSETNTFRTSSVLLLPEEKSITTVTDGTGVDSVKQLPLHQHDVRMKVTTCKVCVCMYTYTDMDTYIFIYIYIYTYMYIYIYAYIDISICFYTNRYTYFYIDLQMQELICMNRNRCIYIKYVYSSICLLQGFEGRGCVVSSGLSLRISTNRD
jgi:hypothetical protein